MEEKKYTCAHCKTGIVNRLPARCPECDKELNKEVEKREKRKLQHARKHIEQPAIASIMAGYILFAVIWMVAAMTTSCAQHPGLDSSDASDPGVYTQEHCMQDGSTAVYTLQAAADEDIGGIIAQLNPHGRGGDIYVNMQLTNMPTNFVAVLRFAKLSCDSSVYVRYWPYRPINNL
jgi:hypothetical protein